VTHEHIRRFEVGDDEEPLQIVDLILGVVHPGIGGLRPNPARS
jgi:hypothetical protein